MYASTAATGVQYYKIYSNLCGLYNCRQIVCDVVSTGASDAAQASVITCCGGILPLVKSSDLQPVTVANLPAGTSINIVVKTTDSVPQGVVIGL